MKLQGFELEVEGSREDATLISNQVGKQIAGMLDIQDIIEGEASEKTSPPPLAPTIDAKPTKAPRKKRASGPSYTREEKEANKAISYSHDPSKYGNPSQNWKVVQKAVWLLYVLKEEKQGDTHPGLRLVNTFNEHFKQSGKITTSNVNRDLGRAKTQQPPLLGEDKVGKLGEWFLTDGGIRMAQELVAEALGESA